MLKYAILTIFMTGCATTPTVVTTFKPVLETSVVVPDNSKKYDIVRITPDPKQVILFNVPVTYESVELTINRLEKLQQEGVTEAYIKLDSPGGSVLDGAKLLSYIKASPMTIHTICDGLCASMAAQLFEVGKTRLMTDKSVLMFHPASGGVQGTLEQMLSQLNMIKLYVDRLDAEVALRSGLDYNEFKTLLAVEYWLESEDALNKNLADNLIFISYDRNSTEVLDIDKTFKNENIKIPEQLKRPGVMIYESIRLL